MPTSTAIFWPVIAQVALVFFHLLPDDEAQVRRGAGGYCESA